MFRGENLSQFNLKNIMLWSALAFQAGAINVGGYLACHRFVTHTTGFATLFGQEIALGNISTAFSVLSVPLFFLMGAMISALLVDQQMIKNKRPHYSTVMFIIALIMTSVTMTGTFGLFGPFGEELSLTRDYVLLALLSLASGLQNASITFSLGAIVRTTHLTGLTTDLGVGLIRIITYSSTQSRKNEFRGLLMRLNIISSFILGSCVSYVFLKVQYWGFAVPALISTLLWWASLNSHRESPTL